MLTALAALGALYFTSEELRANQEELGLSRDQIEVLRQGQLTDRFSKAVEQLGNKDSLEVRLGGIYALERIARDSSRDHPTVMEVLSAYVREHASLSKCSDAETSAPPTTDVQAILTVLGRRHTKQDNDPLQINNTCFRRADLSDANFSDADLRNADLRNADLSGADLSGVHGLR